MKPNEVSWPLAIDNLLALAFPKETEMCIPIDLQNASPEVKQELKESLARIRGLVDQQYLHCMNRISSLTAHLSDGGNKSEVSPLSGPVISRNYSTDQTA